MSTSARYRSRTGEIVPAHPTPALGCRVPIASLVQAVGGLDNSMTLHHAATAPPVHPATVNADRAQGPTAPTRPTTARCFPLSSDRPGGYNHNVLVNGGSDGSGEAIAFVEFSNYKPADLTTYRSLLPRDQLARHRASQRQRRHVGDVGCRRGRARRPDGHLGRSRRRHIRVRGAQQRRQRCRHDQPDGGRPELHPRAHRQRLLGPLRTGHVGLDHGRREHCAATGGGGRDVVLRRHAATMAHRVAQRVTGSTAVAAVDPASQPFATAVGGTRLVPASPRNEVAWRDGGGGASIFFPKPSWQVGRTLTRRQRRREDAATRAVSAASCPTSHSTPAPTPATSSSARSTRRPCGGLTGWLPIGGTSASAPLMAGITADMNEYSLSNGGPAARLRQPVPVRPQHDLLGLVPRHHQGWQQHHRRIALQRAQGLRHGHRPGLGERGQAGGRPRP